MAKAKQLSKKQLALIDDLFKSDKEEKDILAQHKVGKRLFRRWLADATFCAELKYRVDSGYRQSTLLLASKARAAAENLATLAGTGEGETTRKACMDIIKLNPPARLPGVSAPRDDKKEEPSPISPEIAGRLLAVLAEDKDISQ